MEDYLGPIHSLVQNSNLCVIFLVQDFEKLWKISQQKTVAIQPYMVFPYT